MSKKSLRYAAPLFLALCLLAGCSSGPPVIPEDLSVLQFFQRAQEETDINAWENALIYYETFIKRYPDDHPNVAAARYEIAFIHYKQGNYEEAVKDFQDLLDFYEASSLPLDFPMWPKVLADKMSKIIKEKTSLSAPAPVPAPTEEE